MAARGRGVRSERADEREFAGRWGLRLSTLQLWVYRRESSPVMSELKAWLDEPFTHRKVEPQSGLEQAIAYMRKHWPKRTLFLREQGAPLDNNVCERALKKVILSTSRTPAFAGR